MLWPQGRTTEAMETGAASLRLLEDLGPTPQLAWSLLNMARMSTFPMTRLPPSTRRAHYLGRPTWRRRRGLAGARLRGGGQRIRNDTGWDELEAVWRETIEPQRAERTSRHCRVDPVLVLRAAPRLRTRRGLYRRNPAICAAHDLGVFHTIADRCGRWSPCTAAIGRADSRVAEDVTTRPALTPLHRIMALITVALIHARRGEQPVATAG